MLNVSNQQDRFKSLLQSGSRELGEMERGQHKWTTADAGARGVVGRRL